MSSTFSKFESANSFFNIKSVNIIKFLKFKFIKKKLEKI